MSVSDSVSGLIKNGSELRHSQSKLSPSYSVSSFEIDWILEEDTEGTAKEPYQFEPNASSTENLLEDTGDEDHSRLLSIAWLVNCLLAIQTPTFE